MALATLGSLVAGVVPMPSWAMVSALSLAGSSALARSFSVAARSGSVLPRPAEMSVSLAVKPVSAVCAAATASVVAVPVGATEGTAPVAPVAATVGSTGAGVAGI